MDISDFGLTHPSSYHFAVEMMHRMNHAVATSNTADADILVAWAADLKDDFTSGAHQGTGHQHGADTIDINTVSKHAGWLATELHAKMTSPTLSAASLAALVADVTSIHSEMSSARAGM